MTDFEPIYLDMRRHCIETESRRQYNRLLSSYFRNPPNRENLEPVIELLARFLEEADFQYLRSTFPDLSGGSEAKVLLSGAPDNRIELHIEGRRIYSLP